MKRKKQEREERKKQEQEPQYLQILRAMHAAGKLAPGVHQIEVYHDGACGMNSGGMCDCEPTILARKIGDELVPNYVQ